jgi:hypothetical protein
MTNTKTNTNGGTYVVISPFGWQMDKNPFRAFIRLAERSLVTGNFAKGKDFKSDSSLIETSDDSIMVYYIKDESQMAGTNWYRPVDADDKPIGVLVYGGDTNANIVAMLTNPATND